jgi:hypothetical protein
VEFCSWVKVSRSNSLIVTPIHNTDLKTYNFIYLQERRCKLLAVALSATTLCCYKLEFLNSRFQNHKPIFKTMLIFSMKCSLILTPNIFFQFAALPVLTGALPVLTAALPVLTGALPVLTAALPVLTAALPVLTAALPELTLKHSAFCPQSAFLAVY